MRNSTSQKLRIIFLLVLFMCCLTTVQAQVKIPFAMRKNQQIKGDITMIGNNIVNRQGSYQYNAGTRRNPNWITVNVSPNDPYPHSSNEDDDTANDNFNMRYIDIDGDGSTFSSSKATLTIPDLTCSRITYAALYWSATYRYNNSDGTGGRDPFNVIKLKLPGASAYTSVTGTTIFDGFNDPGTIAPAFTANSPYACYADVTALLQGLTNPNGDYTVADIKATQGTFGGGISGGWNLFVVYENLSMSGKYIACFDGFAGVSSGINGGNGVDVTYSGFTTVPAPLTVNAKLAAAALEGDNQISNDKLQFQSGSNPFADLSNSLNPATNFFNANITTLTDDPATLGVYDETIPTLFTARTPNSGNTLGFDSDLIRIPSGYLPNSATSATLKMISTQDTYYMYFNALSIDVIEPEVTLLKTVEDNAQNNIGGTPVTLGAELTYVLTVENIGNDHAVGTTITDILPVNTTYMSTDLSNVPGATATPTYNPATGRTTVVITIPDALLKKKGTPLMVPRKIKIKVKVAETCNELTDRCANIIQNTATIAYHGFENSTPVNDSSVAGGSACGGYIVGPSNFLVDVDDCIYTRNEILCGTGITLTAGDGYNSYSWIKKGESGNPDINMGTTQSIVVTTPGEYVVHNVAAPPCLDIDEHIIVSLANTLLQTNPVAVAGVADDWGQCANDGRVLANIFLCGINDTRLIPSGISAGGGTVSWQKFNSGAVTPANAACTALLPDYCAHNAIACEAGWQEVATGPNYTAATAGEYRIHVVNGGCFVDYYFNVYKNNLDPQVTTQDLVCTTPGEIKVVNVPAGYEYRLLTQAGVQLVPATAGTYTTTSVFPIAATGIYKVELRQVGVTDGCLFEIPNIGIAQRNMTVNVTKTDKTCSIPGSINIQALGVDPQYTYTIAGPGGVTITHGPVVDNSHLFSGLNPGTYTVTVTTEDGCTYNTTTTLNDYSNLNLNAVVAQSPSCDPGYITLTASGGQAPYAYAYYSINGVAQNPGLGDYTLTSPVEIASTAVGTYIFIMKDANGCTVQSNPVTIANIPPIATTSTSQNVSCNGANDGSITFTITSNNGLTTYFELLNASSTVIATNDSGVFTNLVPGSYSVVVVQEGAVTTCRATPVTFNITQPAVLAGSASITTQYTCTSGSATITAANATGGNSPYQYSINGTTFGASQTFTGLLAGTYTVTVKDARGCTFVTAPMTVTAPAPVTNITFSGTAVSCPSLTSDVTLTAVGGAAPFTYAITAPSVVNNGASATFAGLAPGTYTFTVTDSKGCTYTKNHTINAITLISVVGVKDSDVRCFGSSTGALTYTVSGFGAGYNYAVVSTGTAVPSATGVTSGTINLTGLAAGTYTITVTNPTTNCTATAAVTIANPTAALTATKTVVQPTCVTTTGSLAVTASNGWGGYSYTLSGQAAVGPQPSPNFENLAAGNYTLTVTDANGCAFTDTFTITAPVAPVLSISASDLCLAGGTSITVTVNSGTGTAPFQYQLDSGSFQSGATFTGLTAGTHTITVKDANGCTYTTANQTVYPLLTATAVFTKGLDCTASPNAQITVNIAGGSGSGTYTYEVKVGAAAFAAGGSVTGSSFVYSAAAANTYQFRITDAAGCTVTTNTITVAPITMPAFTLTPTDVLCFGASTGAIAVNINTAFGAAPYTIAVTNTSTSTPYGTQTAGLPAGNYTVRVTDSKGCFTNVTTVIGTNTAVAATVTKLDIQCVPNPDPMSLPGDNISAGSITISAASGGAGPYTYNVTNNFGFNETWTTPTATGVAHSFTILSFGIYYVEVIDANGCNYTETVIMASPPGELTLIPTLIATTCATGGVVSVSVGAPVPSSTYQFGILESPAEPYTSNYFPPSSGTDTKLFDSSVPGVYLIPGVTYTFVVYDTTTDCYSFASLTIPNVTPITLTSTTAPHPVTCTGSGDGSVSFTINNYSATSVSYQIFTAQTNTAVGGVGTLNGLTTGPVTVDNFGVLAPGEYYILFTELDGPNAACSKASAAFTITQSANMLVPFAAVTKNDNCNTNAGIITASATFGTGPYSYQIELQSATAPTILTWTGQTSPVFNVEGGDYTVYVKDANNCIKDYDIHIDTDTSPAFTATLAPGTQCTTAEGNFVINVTRTNNGSIGPFLYSLDGGPFQQEGDIFSYTGLNSGTHTIQIQDVNGCTMGVTPTSITIYAPLDITAQPTVQPTCPANVGTITATGSGGSAPANLRYELQTAAGVSVAGPQASPVFAGIAAGNYKVVLSDTATPCTAEVPVALDATVPVTFTTTKDDVNCSGGTDGSIAIILPNTNTDVPYTYTIDGTLSAAVTQNTPIFTNLAADTYTVTVTSGKACSATASVTITQPLALDSTASVTTAFACAPNNTVNTATVTVNAVAGTGTAPYTYSINGTNYTTSNTFAVANPTATQSITAYVKDSNGCTDTFALNINPMPAITSATAVLTTAIECDDNTGIITVTAVGGSGDFTFKMEPSGTPVNTAAGDYDQTFSINSPGLYTFRITDDVTGCYTIVSAAEVMPYDVIDAVATASTPVVCFGSATGTITVDVLNYTGAYNYQVYDGATLVTSGTGNTSTLTIPNVTAGNLFVRITATATPYCSADTNIMTVGSPAAALVPNAAMTANVTCTNNLGEIVAQATGGWGSYQYQLVNNTTSTTVQSYAANNTFTGLSAGNYTVSVRDSGNCIASQNITLTVPAPIAASISGTGTALLCNDDTTASVQATGVTGGQGSYQYILNTYNAAGTIIVSSTGAQSSPVFTGLGAGIYSIKVVDGWGCDLPATATVTITEPAPLVGTLSLTKTLTCTTLAEVTISATGGTAPYTYSTDNVTYTSTTVYPVAAGTYTYYVKDANGCAAVMTNSVDIPAVPAINLNLDLSAATINCSGGSNAQIVSNATGGLGSYQYSLLNVGTAVTTGPSASGTFSGLSAGTYRITVNSGDCSATSSDIVITNPTVLASVPTITHIQCFGQATGSISFATTGGTGIVQYAISPNLSQFVDTNVLTQLTAGTYDVVVQDQKGCFLLFNLTVTQPGQIMADITVHSDEACLGSGDGTINVDVWGGSPPYQISTDNFVTYATVPSTGAVTSYLIEDLVPGTTLVWVRDANGCSIFPAMQQVILPGVDMNPQTAVVETCVNNAPNNNVTITITPTANAVGVIEYSINNTTWQSSNVFNNVGLAAGTYTAYVRHTLPGVAPVVDLECVQTKPFTIAAHNAIAATAAVTTPIACNGGTGAITINVTASTGALQYAVGPAFTFGSSNVFSGLTAATYDFKVKDVLGCELDITGVVLSQPTAVTASVSALIDEICFGDNDGTFTVTPSGGTPNYQVSIDGGTTFTALSPSAVVYSNRTPNNYTVVVKDANGCTYTLPAPVTIAPGADLQASISPVQVCNVTTVTVSVNPLEAANVTYYLDGVAQPSNVITATGLTPGSHTIDVTHTNGCNANFSFNVAPVVPIVMGATSKTDVSCFGGTNGTATVTVTGGTAPLTYAIAPNVLPLTFGTYQPSNTFTGLAAGSYVINVKDALGCESPSATITVGQPAAALTATATSTNEICINAADGTITVTPANGTGPYQARINGGIYTASFVTSTTFNTLAPGNYTVEVRDANGCTYTISPAITITPGADLQPSVIVDPYCQNNVIHNIVLISDNVFANIGLLQYAVDGGTLQAGGDFYDLAPGAHTATVQHANGCQETIPFTVPTLLAISPTVSATTNINCFGDATGAITVTATGGTGTLSYAIADADVLPLVFGTPQPTGVFTGLTAGNYVVSIVDDNLLCETQVTATLTEPAAALTATIGGQTNVLCFGNATGSATVNVTGGTTVYSYSWNTTPVQTTATATGLTAGTYTVTVTDANLCTTTQSFTITQPAAALVATAGSQTNVLCFGNATGAATVNVTGGTGVYSYSWNTTPVQTTATATGLTAGTYTVTITDANLCTTTQSFTITEPAAALVATAVSQTDVLCFGNATGAATVNVTGGTGVYSYSWNTTPAQTTATATGLTAGIYTVTVTDANGCTATQSFTITQPAAALVATAGSQTDVLCFGNATGAATVNVTGGTGVYSYSWNTTPVQTTATATGLTAGTYTVTVTDANLCTTTQSFTITQPAAALTATIGSQTNVLCFGNATGAATVNVTGGTGAYSYSWNTTPVQTTATATGLTAGTYTVTITDANLCTTTQSFTITQPSGALTATIGAQTNVLCFGNATGAATVNVTGGTGAYSYSWNTTPAQTTATATGLIAGTYTVTITDANLCTATQSFTITQPAAALVATAVSQTDVLCFGNATGTATVNVTGGTGVYSYSWNTTPVQTTATATGLTAGTYTVTVTDANLCTTTQSFTITQPAGALTATIGAQTNVLCFGNATGTATVNVTGGTGVYSYSWNTTPVQTTATITGLTAGTYTVTVTDANLCTTTQSFTITEPAAALVATAGSQTDVLCFGNATGAATVNVTGGTGAYSYSWNTTPVQTTATATGLTAGTYTVTITDANLCTTTQSFTITQPAAALVATAVSQTDVLCFGNATGAATVNVTGGTGAYSYSWNTTPVQTTATATGLTAGTYTVTVTDANLCTATQSFTITQPSGALTATIGAQTNVLCFGNATGAATVNVTGGTGAYSYSWNTTPVQTTATITGLTAGTYTVTITDANLCTTTQSFTITEPAAALVATAGSQTNVLCFGNATGTATVNVTGGTGVYSYSWNTTPAQTTATATGLTAGTYTVTITDANLCTATQSFTISEPAAALVATAVSQTDVLCFGNATGTATVNVTGGTGVYSYSWNTTPVQTTATATGLTAGTYTVTITDANLCTTTQSFTITQPSGALTATIGAQTNVLCFGNATGAATVNVTGGTGVYSYSWNTTPVQTTAAITGLTAGTYTVTVTDANLCTATQSFTITQPAAALTATIGSQTNVLCFGNATGTATVNVTGGTGAYSYSWNTTPVQTTATATGLTAGTYTVTVTDANLCTTTQSFTITQPVAALVATAVSQTDVLCFGNATGAATVNVTGGTGAYSYSWNTTPVQTTATATGLTAGTYTVTVTDANGCTSTQSFTITQPSGALTATIGAQTNVLCFGNATGAATVNVTGGTGAYSYSWNTTPVQTTATISGLTAGTYTVTVTDANLCTTTQSFTITQPAGALAAAAGTTQTNVLCFGNATGSATIVATGGTTPYTYNWDTIPVQTTATATGLTAGTYTVTVTDANGCNISQSFTITQPAAALVATAGSQTDVLCFGNATGSAAVNVTGGTGAYSYSWNTTPVQTTATATGLTAGTYTVTVTDANGCSAAVSYTITQPTTALSATVAHTDESCLNDNNGTITVTPAGGIAPYQASLNGGAFTTPAVPAGTPIVFNGLTGGTYTIQVRDANGCIFNVPSTTVLTGIVINPQVSYTQVCNEADIVVTVNASVAGQVTYSLDGGTPQASNVFNNVILNPAVPHVVTVTHVQGCSQDTAPFTIAPVVPIVLNSTNVNVTNVACHGKDVGSIVVNATGGTGPLQYAITWNIWPTQFYGPSNTFNDLLAGDYTVWVKDAMGCVQSLTVTITEPAEELILAAAVGQHESCIGAHDGTIDVTLVQGGTPPYSIALDSPNNFQPYNPAATPDFAGLYGRTLPYEIYVRDASGCYAKAIVTIQKGVSLVPGLQTVLSCVNNAPVNTVTATLNTIVDNVEYKLETATGTLIQDFSPVHTWTLAPGNYIYTVRHINGCQKTYPFTVQPRVPITVTSAIPTDAACNGGTDGTLTVTATGGTGNLQYGISPDYVMTSNPVFTGLAAGTYTVRVQDQYGCYVDFSNFPPIGEPAVLVMTETMNLPEVCVDDNNGAFEIDITGGTAPYATSLDANGPFVTDQTLFENLDGGTYTVYIQDAKGCTTTQDVTLISPLDIDAKAEVVYNCDQNTVTITTNGAINPGELNYTIVGPKDGNNPPQTSNIFANLEDGTYTVEVINTVTGCTDVTEPFKIISVPDLAISLSMSGLNQFTATVMGGQGPYQYTLDGDSNGSKNVFTYYRSGVYVVTVTDARGCTREARIEVNFIDIILPDVITPDDDGQNDTWSPGNTANYPNINSFVFDRYGRKLATLRQGDTWDGTYDGHPMPTGDYWYLVELGDADGRSFVGHFTIYR